jgi:Ca-activated chloride channel family protein
MKQRWIVLVTIVMALVAGACNVDVNQGSDLGGGTDVPSGCAAVDMAVSPEKFDLLTQLAEDFNGSDAAKKAKPCAFVRVNKTSSGIGATLLADGWPDPARDGPRPVIWSPAAASWGAILNQRLGDKGAAPMAPADAKPFMVTPLVIAMPKPMADALGYPETPIGFGDLLALAQNPEGWASKGHPEWGAFKLGKTNPNFSTSGLSATIAQYYAATGKQSDLTLEDINRPDVDTFMRGVESSVVHYGDITPTFLNGLYRNDRAGVGLTYISAVAVEEKSILDYNAGNPDGILDSGEQPRKPRVPLVAIYPKDGTLFSDSPFFVLDASWVKADQKKAARAFETFVQQEANQRKVLKFGFRPGNPSVPVGEPIVKANGVDPAQPQTTLGVPAPDVLTKLLTKWGEQRKAAKVLLVLDVSGSMGEEVGGGETKLDLAKRASIDALDQFKAEDLVGLRIFSTNIAPKEPRHFLDLVPFGEIAGNREAIATKIAALVPTEGTPLYRTASDSFDFVKSQFDPARINAVVLLTDGRNEDTFNDLNATIAKLRAGAEGQSSQPVRLFTIAYGQDADKATLKRLAEATNAATYDASDPQSIDKVFTAVVSNF